MSLEIEKSLFDIRDFLVDNLQAQITAVNSEVTDSVTISMPKDFEVDKFDIYDGARFPRSNLILEETNIEALTLGADEFRERLLIIYGDKAFKDENVLLKCKRLAEATRRTFVVDSTAGGAVEFITVTGVRSFLPVGGIAICEVICAIQRQIARQYL